MDFKKANKWAKLLDYAHLLFSSSVGPCDNFMSDPSQFLTKFIKVCPHQQQYRVQRVDYCVNTVAVGQQSRPLFRQKGPFHKVAEVKNLSASYDLSKRMSNKVVRIDVAF